MLHIKLMTPSLSETESKPSPSNSSYLSTQGSSIVDDSTGEAVSLVGANWFGAEGNTLIPNGLWARNYQEMMDEMVDAGLNTLRIPFSPAVITDEIVTSGFRTDLNPDLVGKTPLEVMDAIIDYAGQIGINVILDMHRITPGVGKQEDGLWFNDSYSLEDLGADWQTIAGRYAGNDTVVGVDLFNEPSGDARWGDEAPDPSLDWAAAATYLGNTVHKVNPDVLVLVEGIHIVDNAWYWVGGNLSGVADHPITLDQPGKLVYSPHDYPSSVVDVPWLQGATSEDMVELFRDHWGFIAEEGIAPILVGETGARMNDSQDTVYLDALFGYLGELEEASAGSANVTWWGWNPNSGDTGGLLDNDWRTLHEDKLVYLDSIGGGAEAQSQSIIFEMDHNTHVDRVFYYTVSGDTATEGEDFAARDGVLHFAAGETTTSVNIGVYSDGNIDAGQENLTVDIFWQDGRLAGSYDVVLDDAPAVASPDAAFSEIMTPDKIELAMGAPDGVAPGIAWAMPEIGYGTALASGEVDVTTGDIEVKFEIIQTWGNHFFARAYITNTSDRDISDWELDINAHDFEILEIHNAGFGFDALENVHIEAPDWNSTLSAGETANFGIDGLMQDLG